MGQRASAPSRVMTPDPPRTWSRDYPGKPDQVAQARAFLALALAGCPAAEDAVLLMSEICANAIQHSHSRRPGGRFTVEAEVRDDDSVRVQVTDEGGCWQPQQTRTDGRGHGLDIVRALAEDWGRHGDAATGWTIWFRLSWAAPMPDDPDPPQTPLSAPPAAQAATPADTDAAIKGRPQCQPAPESTRVAGQTPGTCC
jgi:hypothetical protein